ncbi:hypothetical protein, partial [Streptomyces sp. NPDC051704]|uniref:hypothetical protein n=1 Tax=Streptomyces sp. NPDC051704 TaxID=3365671 RepID=UPI0037B07F6B
MDLALAAQRSLWPGTVLDPRPAAVQSALNGGLADDVGHRSLPYRRPGKSAAARRRSSLTLPTMRNSTIRAVNRLT